MSELHALVVTYRRVEQLGVLLERLQSQTRRPDTTTVVDNANQADVRQLCLDRNVRYLPMEENLGPAGALAAGIDVLLATAGDSDRILCLDDDEPPWRPDLFELLERVMARATTGGPVGCAGTAGGRFSTRSGRLSRLLDDELTGIVRVDYIGGGQFPLYAAAGLRAAGAHDPSLFFGFEELDLGLRLQQCGYSVVADGDLWAARRRELGRAGMSERQASASRPRLPSRRYLATRNLVLIARRYGTRRARLYVTCRAVLGGLSEAVRLRQRRSLQAAAAGAVDAWRAPRARNPVRRKAYTATVSS